MEKPACSRCNIDMHLGDLHSCPGEKVSGLWHIGGPGYWVGLPTTIVTGQESGPNVAVTGGIHGSEYCGVEAAIRLAKSIDPSEVRGRVTIISVANTPGFYARSSSNPLDRRNLNGAFPGSSNGTVTDLIAFRIFHDVIQPSDFYIDLHGGDTGEALIPFVIYQSSGRPEQDKMSLKMAAAYEIPFVVDWNMPGTSLAAATTANKPCILAEAGAQGVLDEESVMLHMRGVRRVLSVLGSLRAPGIEVSAVPEPTMVMNLLRSEHDGIFYPAVGVGQDVEKGQVVGQLRSLFGTLIANVSSPSNGKVLFMVSCPPVSPGSTLVGIARPQAQ